MKKLSITVIFFSLLFNRVLAQPDTAQLDAEYSPTQIKALFQSATRTRNHWRLGAAFFARAQYVEYVQQDYQSAILDYTESAEIFLSLRDSLSYYTIITRLVGVYIVAEPSFISQKQNELSRAILYFRRHNHLKRLGYALINRGNAYQKQQRWQEAYPNYREAVGIAEKIQDNYMRAITDHFFGNYCEVHHQYNIAIQYLQKSYAWSKENNIAWLQARNLLYIGANFYALRKYSQADRFLRSALNVIMQRHHVLEIKKETLVMLAKNCRAANRYQQASMYAFRALAVSDSLTAEEKAKDLRLFQRNLELEQRKYELSKAELAKKVTQSELKRSTQLTRLLIAIVALLFFGIIITAFYFRQRIQTNIQKQQRLKAEIERVTLQNKFSILNAWTEGQEKERERIALDIHDSLGGLLAHLKALTELSHVQFADLKEKIKSLLEVALDELRMVLYDLQPLVLNDLSLFSAVENFIQRQPFSPQTNIYYEHFGNDTLLDTKQKKAMYHIIQELLTNTQRHARANEILVQLMIEAKIARIYFQDDGVGFDTEKQTGMGLYGVHARVEALNGYVQITSEKNWGTTILVEIPL